MINTFCLILTIFIWGYLHSLLASHKIKALVKRYFLRSTVKQYRIFYNIVASLSILPILWLMYSLPDYEIYIIGQPWKILAEFVQILAFFILVIAAKQTGIAEFIGLDVKTKKLNEKEKSLKTGGLYQYVRHPIYSAGLVILWFTPILTVNYLTVAICLTLYILIGAALEEHKLINEFGDQYQNYKEKVPMLVPGLHRNKN